jgi:hypothetical protein
MFGTRDVLIAYSNLQLECLLATRALISAAGAFQTKRNDRAWRLRSGWDIDHAKYTTPASACSRTQTIKPLDQRSSGFLLSEPTGPRRLT